MENFKITIGDDGKPTQYFNGKRFKLQPGERYFNTGKWKMHQWVWVQTYGEYDKKKFHVHHKDENTWNNEPENLILKEKSKHLGDHTKKYFKDNPDKLKQFYTKGVENAKEWHKSDDGIEWHKQHAKDYNFGVFDYGIRVCIACNKEFNARHVSAAVCSDKCGAKHRRDSGIDNETRKCVICGNEFISNKYLKQKCCSKKCGATLGHINNGHKTKCFSKSDMIF